ncbi:hypothetical protein MMC21_007049 [Puttea exsequens]|nr:hypothetical protein [Puttea exsequens]
MVHEETGFLLRTPPLGIECTQRVPASATGSTPFLHLWNSASEPLGKTQPASWCLPRPEHPARMIVFEIISREERAEDSPFPRARGNISVPLSKTSFDASIDKLIFRKRWVSQTSQPVLWTAESATELFPATDAKHASAVRGSKLNDPMSTEQTIVDKNTSRHNDKHLVIWRYNDDQSSDELMQNFWGAPTGPELLRSLKIGDSIALWARAKGGSEGRGRACCNIIERVKMHVFWAI